MKEAQNGFIGEDIRLADFDETQKDPVQGAIDAFSAEEIDANTYMSVGVYQKEN